MTIEEAIKDIKENIQPSTGGKSMDMAIEALEKQIPKKTTDYIGFHKGNYCPCCGKKLDEWIDDYCNRCGQKIDWSEVEE